MTSFTATSLRVLLYVAGRPGRKVRIAELAAALGAGDSQLVKAVHFLGQCGWLRTARGQGGGIELAQAPT